MVGVLSGAARDGGGNFGIFTSFEFRCAEIGPAVYSGPIIKKFEDTKAYMRFHHDYVRGLPNEMTAWMVVRHAPPLPFLPKDVHGKMVVVVPLVWLGEEAEGAELVEPIREATASHGEAIGMNPWVGSQSGFDGLVEHGARSYWKSHHLKELSDDCIDRITEFASSTPTAESESFIPIYGSRADSGGAEWGAPIAPRQMARPIPSAFCPEKRAVEHPPADFAPRKMVFPPSRCAAKLDMTLRGQQCER